MKFIHISDLHLGKIIDGVSMIDNSDQPAWIEKFLEKVKEIQPDAIVIAGDIYDRSSPSGEAVLLFDHLLTQLSKLNIPVLVIAGNHDSPERLSFAKGLLTKSQVYIAGKLEKKLTSVTLSSRDGSGDVTFWLMPYLFPALVNSVLGEETESLHDYDKAVRALLEAQNIDFTRKNVLIAHQNVTAFGCEVQRGGSESMVGGVGQIDYSAFDGFTYVALGHIHSAYPVGREEIRYCGTPLCYHFDEVKQPEKGPLLVQIQADGTVEHQRILIEPLHPMRVLEGSYAQIQEDLEKNPRQNEYLKIRLKDSKLTPEISTYLHQLAEKRGSVILEQGSDFSDYSAIRKGLSRKDAEEMAVEDLFSGFYKERRNGVDPEDPEMDLLKEAGRILRQQTLSGDREPSDQAVDKLLTYLLKQED